MEYVLRTFSLVKTYKDVNVVDNVSMNIPRGQIYGFVGRNGAGKTTLMRLVCGLINKSGGSFTLFGKEDEDRDIGRARRRMGAMVESPVRWLSFLPGGGMTGSEGFWNILSAAASACPPPCSSPSPCRACRRTPY